MQKYEKGLTKNVVRNYKKTTVQGKYWEWTRKLLEV